MKSRTSYIVHRTSYIVLRTSLWLAITVLIMPATGWGAEVSSRSLIENAKFYDGRSVTYRGEAVGAVMRRGDYGWVNVNDGDNAIGVWCPAALLDRITRVGDYRTKGDIVRIDGIFNRACREHGGDLDIHADILTVVSSGYVRAHHIDPGKARLAAALFLVTAVAAVVFRKRLSGPMKRTGRYDAAR